MSKKMICRIITLVLLSVCLPVLAETAGQVTEKQYRPAYGISNEKALEGYINRVFGITPEITPRNASLTGLNQEIYDALVPLIRQVAAGQQQFTTFTVQVSGTDGFDLGKIVDALLVNLPFDMYWYDKDELIGVSYNSSGLYSFFFPVAPDFSADGSAGSTEINTAIGESITTALNTAQNIIDSNQNESDTDKLTAYKNAICGLVSYNQAVIDDDATPYGNPWQMIWVFDGNPDTNVVCEGYSKAFKYLCDNSSFRSQNLSVSIVTGTMIDDTGEGPHMWNLVAMGDGKNYLADITNCDEGSVGYPDALFMAGSGRPYSDNGLSGYIFSANGTDIVYAYDSEMAGLYTEAELTVSETAYTPPAEPQIVADGICGDDLTWTLDENGMLTVSGTGDMYDFWDPAEIPWAAHMDAIVNIVIEPGVTSLGAYAFNDCENLAGVSLPDGLNTIGLMTFYQCKSLSRISLPDSLTEISYFAFYGCECLTSFAIPANLSVLDSSVLTKCRNLSEITIDPSNTSFFLEDGVLFSADGTELICYPPKKADSTYTVPATVTAIYGTAFSCCENLTVVTLPASLTDLGEYAFDGCLNLTDVYFNGSPDAWDQLMAVRTEPDDLSKAQVHFPYLGSGSCGENLTWMLNNDGTLIVSGTGSMDAYDIEYAYDGAEYQIYGTSPWYALRDQILDIAVESGATSVGSYAFMDCGQVSGLSLPDSITDIGEGAFRKCSGLTSFALPAGVISIGNNAFAGCSSLAEYTAAGTNTAYTAENGVLFSADRSLLLSYPQGKTDPFYTVPDSVTSIAPVAFAGCKSLTSVILGDHVSSIGESAFEGCSSLTGLTIPDSVVSIEPFAFNYCTGLTSLTVGTGLDFVGLCSFNACDSLTDIFYKGSRARWNLIQISDENGPLLAAEKHYHAGVPVPEANLALPAALTEIESEAFAGLPAGTVVWIPVTVTAIADDAFDEGTVIIAPADSFAAGWAANHGFDCFER